MNLFENNSIRGRLLRLYLIVILITALGIAFFYRQSKEIETITNEVIGLNEEIRDYASKIDAEVSYLAFLAQNYLMFQEDYIKSRAEGVWEDKILIYADSMVRKIQELEEPRSQSQAYQTRKDIIKLKKYWEKFLTQSYLPEQKDDWIDNNKSLELLINKIRRDLLELAGDRQAATKFAILEIKNNAEQTRNSVILLSISVVLLCVLFSFFMIRNVLKSNEKVTKQIKAILEGDLPDTLDESLTELKPLVESSDHLIYMLGRLKNLADDVSLGKYDTDVSVFGDKGVLGHSIHEMRENLQSIARENTERNWLNEGYAKFAEILRNTSRDREIFYETVIAELVRYLSVNQGGIFVVNHESGDNVSIMELKASYAYQRKKFLVRKIHKEEGLVGQAWREKDIVYVTDVPDEYADITSGLGQSKPKSILIVPLITNDEVLGVLELASFEEFPSYKKTFVDKVGESIATTIARLKVDMETQRLLDESQYMAERMKAQEEEMVQSMEELVTTQEKMELNSNEMRTQLRALNESFIMMEMNTQGYLTEVNDLVIKTTGYEKYELLNQHYSILLGKKANQETVQEDWDDVTRGNYIKGVFPRYRKNDQKFWIYEVMYPLYNSQGEIYKVCIVGYDITRQKEQEQKIKEQLNELYMSKRDVVNRIREIESKARNKMLRMKMEFEEELKAKDHLIEQLKKELQVEIKKS